MTRPRNVAERFWEKVDRLSDGCWIWTASLGTTGYGQFFFEGKPRKAHRVAFLLTHGYMPDPSLDIDHLCRNPRCVRPDHLEVVTHQVNVARGAAGPTSKALAAERTHCVNGHEWSPENTYYWRDGARRCRTCGREAQRSYQARKRGVA